MLEIYVELLFESPYQRLFFLYYFPEYLNLHACKSEKQFALMYFTSFSVSQCDVVHYL